MKKWSGREREREKGERKREYKAHTSSLNLVEEKTKGRTGRTSKKAERARSSANQNGEGGNLKRLISLHVTQKFFR